MSAAELGWYPQAVDDERNRDADFDKACEVAMLLHNDRVDDAIRERAIDGLQETKFHEGEWYTSKTTHKYSDQLAALYAKRMIPAYRDKVQVDGLQSSGVLVVPASVADPQEWAKKFAASSIDDDDPND